ncbi:MAG: methionine adenosyltransferase [Gammaproteobacteria bacterium]|jgi:S-adenosylmethionine synthetase|nr:methionine adenosyltransferase [Gammaproteobacteria bacterium]
MSDDFIFTSESVTAGHPDKLCDQVSDAIVDHVLTQDPNAGINAECAVSSGVLFISAHYATEAGIAITDIARDLIREIGYPRDVFDADACAIMTSFMDHTDRDYRRLDLDAMDDETLGRITVKDQATVFGYACDQTEHLMPLPVTLAHRIAKALDGDKLKWALPYLLPDAKTQVGIEYADGVPKRLHSIALETSQHDSDSPQLKQLQTDLMEQVLEPELADAPIQPDGDTLFFVNPDGPVIGGGPAVHSGLTGRKTGIDTYGEYARHSGAALSGKDPLRVDRVGAYAARWAAKNVVAAGLAGECEVQLSYSIGAAAPVSVRARTYGSGKIDDAEIARRLMRVFDFRVGAIVRDLRLRHLPSERKHGFYRRLACCGHMGRVDLEAPWETLDRVEALRD